MPLGTYAVMDGNGHPIGSEEFQLGSAPAGWRYFSTITTELPEPHTETVDLTCDEDHRPLRLRIHTGRHELLVEPDEEALVGTRDGQPVRIPWDDGCHLDYLSPVFNAATAARLDATTEIEVAFLEAETIEPSTERQRYELLGEQEVETPVGRFQARAWRYTALSSGWTRRLWVAGTLLVAYEGLFSLTTYEPGQTGPFPL